MIGRLFVFLLAVLAAMIFLNYVTQAIIYKHPDAAWAAGAAYDMGLA